MIYLVSLTVANFAQNRKQSCMTSPQIEILIVDQIEDHSSSETISIISYLEIAVITHLSYEYYFFLSLSFVFLGPHPLHMEVPRLGIKSEL